GQQVAAVSAVVHAVEQVVGGDEELHHVARVERGVALIACAAATATSAAALALRGQCLADGCATTSGTTRAEARTTGSAAATGESTARSLTAKCERATHSQIGDERR